MRDQLIDFSLDLRIYLVFYLLIMTGFCLYYSINGGSSDFTLALELGD